MPKNNHDGIKTGLAAFIAVTAFFTLFSGCVSTRPLTVQDSTGAKITLNEPAKRIVSTVPSNTEILYALGLKDRVVGLTRYCAKTCDTRGKVVIGGWVSPDFEKIRGLKPDLIFAFGGIQGKYLGKFREIAPTYCFDPATVEETLRVILDIGQLTRCNSRAEEIVAKERKVLADIRGKLSSLPAKEKPGVVRVFGTDANVTTVGGKSFLTDVIRQAGGVNVFGDADANSFHVAFERLAALDPDVLIVHGEKTDEKKKKTAFEKSPRFSGLKAVKNGRVLVYSCDDICHPNASIAETVGMVARGLHPDLFKDVQLHR